MKAAFRIGRDGRLKLADEQPEPTLMPEYAGEGPAASLRYDTDLVGAKPTTDVILNGTAYAPGGRPATEFPASLRVGPVRKEIKVVGGRTWKAGLLGGPSAPEPVASVPVVYERAYGGFDQSDPDPKRQRMDARNPAGCGLVTEAGRPLPNFEYPAGRLEKAGPAGFGALASFWSPRRELAGTYDEKWKATRFPLVPADWDVRWRLCSPPDQRPDRHLEGGEPVELVNLTPTGSLRFDLPRVRLTFRTAFGLRHGARTEEHAGRLSTVILEPDHPRVILVWLAVLPCRTDTDYLNETVVREVPWS